ncbi:MAG: ATP-dependent DNA helicase [Burkholderiaceae bacterium]|nr:ATP-dependent DNA helicase [Burkholderiaceae bacterium]
MLAPADPALLPVSARTLCEFAARRGDLDMRFGNAPTALDGIAGHRLVGSRRSPGYERELRLEGRFDSLLVRGRADGYDPVANRLEEIKTHRRGDAPVPGDQLALHRAQANVYGWLLCSSRGLSELEVALVYFDIGSQRETVLSERHSAEALKAVFEKLCRRFLDWAREQVRHRADRDAALSALGFPHAGFRDGQRRLAESVYRATVSRRCLLAQAPTGIGKTIGTLFAALKAAPGQQLDKVFYLTAKTPGRQLALDALERIRASHPGGAPLRVTELVAREKACEHPDKACHGESCPLAAGFHDRLPQARRSAAEAQWLDRLALREIASSHRICPYYLGQEMVRWSDIVVGDYNHFFDRGGMLHGLCVQEGWRASLLVDEAHNLVDRARAMYTAELSMSDLKAIRKTAPASLRRPIGALQRAWPVTAPPPADAYRVLERPPAAFDAALARLTGALGEHFGEHPGDETPELLAWYFALLRFQDIAELHGPHSICDLRRDEAARDATICIRNVVPAPLLQARWAAAHSATLFSATLSPSAHYVDLLGLPESTVFVDVPSPFRCGQLAARVIRNVSTRFRDRERSLDSVVSVMAGQFRERPGNYLAFFGSFDYLQRAASRLNELHPGIATWAQSRRMPEAQRDEFLARFTCDSKGIGFAVLGGAFAEGIDLPGARLIGAFVATLGLPQVNEVNEQFRRRIDANLGDGYEHTYLYPGVRKVVQAAGRVVRTPEDRGTVFLIDDRYARSEVRRLLPGWWSIHDA